jgi:tetratricopeptide (TPR) repeat protein
VAFSRQGAYDRAIGDYNRALSLDPRCAEAAKNKRIALQKTGEGKAPSAR